MKKLEERKKKKWGKHGAVMIEAALVLPLTIIVIMTLLSLAFYYHEQAVLQTKQYACLREKEQHEGKTNFHEAEFVTRVDFLSEALQSEELKNDQK